MIDEIDQQILLTLTQERDLLFWDLTKRIPEDPKALWARVEALAGEGKIEMVNSGLANDPFYISITHLGSLDLPKEGEQRSQKVPETNSLPNNNKIEKNDLEIDLTPSEPVESSQMEDTIHDEGWVKLHRKSIRSQVFQSEGLWKLWSWCLLRANHEDTWIPITTGRGITEILVKRGQFVYGRKSAAKILKMDESTIYKRMMKLKNIKNLVIESNTHYSIVTILNYELYQGSKDDEVTPKVTPKEHPSNTDKNDKNIKNKRIGREKPPPDPRVKEFFDYWGETFQKEIGQPYTFSYAKDGNLTKNLLAVHELPTLQQLTKTFFKDEQAKRRGLTIGIFYQEINRLLSLKAMDPLEQAKRELSQRKEEKDGGNNQRLQPGDKREGR